MPEDEKTITELFKNQESLPDDDINLSLEQMELSARKFGVDYTIQHLGPIGWLITINCILFG